MRKPNKWTIWALSTVLGASFLTGCSGRQPGDPLKPGFNVFSKEQDVQLGQEAAAQVRQSVDIVKNPELQNYISRIGEKLAAQPQAGGYPYSFTLINDPSINAFALPGGPIFVNSGLLDAADNEAQLAGVLAHEISHVALRHGTNQASKQQLLQIPAVLAGAAVGSGSVLSQLGQLGLGFGLNSLLLKYSRDAENQADALGTHIMAEAGYNPIAMANFFEKLEAGGGQRAPQFLSSHPNPGNREKAVQAEIRHINQTQFNAGTGQFDQMKRLAAQLPPPNRPEQGQLASSAAPPSPPGSSGWQQLNTNRLSIAHPPGWQVFGDQTSAVVTIAPRQGLVRGRSGGIAIGFGSVVGYYRPESGRLNLRRTTQELANQLVSVNQGMQVQGQQGPIRVDGQPAMITSLAAPSPYGGRELNLLLTVARPEGLFYLVVVGPESDAQAVQSAFQQMGNSIRFR